MATNQQYHYNSGYALPSATSSYPPPHPQQPQHPGHPASYAQPYHQDARSHPQYAQAAPQAHPQAQAQSYAYAPVSAPLPPSRFPPPSPQPFSPTGHAYAPHSPHPAPSPTPHHGFTYPSPDSPARRPLPTPGLPGAGPMVRRGSVPSTSAPPPVRLAPSHRPSASVSAVQSSGFVPLSSPSAFPSPAASGFMAAPPSPYTPVTAAGYAPSVPVSPHRPLPHPGAGPGPPRLTPQPPTPNAIPRSSPVADLRSVSPSPPKAVRPLPSAGATNGFPAPSTTPLANPPTTTRSARSPSPVRALPTPASPPLLPTGAPSGWVSTVGPRAGITAPPASTNATDQGNASGASTKFVPHWKRALPQPTSPRPPSSGFSTNGGEAKHPLRPLPQSPPRVAASAHVSPPRQRDPSPARQRDASPGQQPLPAPPSPVRTASAVRSPSPTRSAFSPPPSARPLPGPPSPTRSNFALPPLPGPPSPVRSKFTPSPLSPTSESSRPLPGPPSRAGSSFPPAQRSTSPTRAPLPTPPSPVRTHAPALPSTPRRALPQPRTPSGASDSGSSVSSVSALSGAGFVEAQSTGGSQSSGAGPATPRARRELPTPGRPRALTGGEGSATMRLAERGLRGAPERERARERSPSPAFGHRHTQSAAGGMNSGGDARPSAFARKGTSAWPAGLPPLPRAPSQEGSSKSPLPSPIPSPVPPSSTTRRSPDGSSDAGASSPFSALPSIVTSPVSRSAPSKRDSYASPPESATSTFTLSSFPAPPEKDAQWSRTPSPNSGSRHAGSSTGQNQSQRARGPDVSRIGPPTLPELKFEAAEDILAFGVPSISLPEDAEDADAPGVPSISINLSGDDDVPGISVNGVSAPPAITISSSSSVHSQSSRSSGSSGSSTATTTAKTHGGPRKIVKSGTLTCGGCGGQIVGRTVSAMGARWHPACFRCCVCNELLENLSSYEHEGRAYCHLDYHEKFAPRCYHCETAIVDERFITLDDQELGQRTYHEQHFFCAECGNPFLAPSQPERPKPFANSTNLHPGEGVARHFTGDGAFSGGAGDVGFTVYRGHPYCENCHVRLRNPKCKKCRKPIRDGARAVEALGAKWCWECFVCASCEKPFEDPAFFQRDGKPFCEHCFSVMIKNEL